MLHRSLSKEEILELVITVAAQSVPDDLEGDISADFDEEGGIDIYFIPDKESFELN